jgi:hypothetical protein
MIATSQINFCENDRTTKLIKYVIKTMYWMSIPHSYIVNSSVINTHTPRAIFFGTKKTGTTQGERLSFTYPLSSSSYTWR